MSIGELLIQSVQQMDEREQMTPACFEQLYAQEFKPDVEAMRKQLEDALSPRIIAYCGRHDI